MTDNQSTIGAYGAEPQTISAIESHAHRLTQVELEIAGLQGEKYDIEQARSQCLAAIDDARERHLQIRRDIAEAAHLLLPEDQGLTIEASVVQSVGVGNNNPLRA